MNRFFSSPPPLSPNHQLLSIAKRSISYWRSFQGLILMLIGVWGVGWLGLTLRLEQIQARSPQPQAILVLGGNPYRVHRAAQLARQYLHLKIIISDYPIIYKHAEKLLQSAKIHRERVTYDFCATDTVTNFTCTVKLLTQNQINHIYLVTSDSHMARAITVGTVVLGSRGIAITPAALPERSPSEPPYQTLRDHGRSLLWLLTGRTGASLNPRNAVIQEKLRQNPPAML